MRPFFTGRQVLLGTFGKTGTMWHWKRCTATWNLSRRVVRVLFACRCVLWLTHLRWRHIPRDCVYHWTRATNGSTPWRTGFVGRHSYPKYRQPAYPPALLNSVIKVCASFVKEPLGIVLYVNIFMDSSGGGCVVCADIGSVPKHWLPMAISSCPTR